MSVETQPDQTTEPESCNYDVLLQGTGATAPTVTVGKGVTVTRTSAGLLKLTFAESPGPNFLGGAFGFGDATAANVLGWSVCFGAYTAPAAGAKATLVVTTGNSSFAAADMAATSSVKLALRFKNAPIKL